MAQRHYDLEERLLEFAVEIIQLTEALPNAGGKPCCGPAPAFGYLAVSEPW